MVDEEGLCVHPCRSQTAVLRSQHPVERFAASPPIASKRKELPRPPTHSCKGRGAAHDPGCSPFADHPSIFVIGATPPHPANPSLFRSSPLAIALSLASTAYHNPPRKYSLPSYGCRLRSLRLERAGSTARAAARDGDGHAPRGRGVVGRREPLLLLPGALPPRRIPSPTTTASHSSCPSKALPSSSLPRPQLFYSHSPPWLDVLFHHYGVAICTPTTAPPRMCFAHHRRITTPEDSDGTSRTSPG